MMRVHPYVMLAIAVATLVGVGACRAQPESIAAAAAPPLSDNSIRDEPVGPLPGRPENTRVEPTNPFANDRVALQEGRKLFVAYNCSGCHGDYGGGGMGPSLRDEDWIYGSSDAKVANSIASGRAHGMPSWGTMITTEQVWKLAAYIKSMRTPLEPEPPPGD